MKKIHVKLKKKIDNSYDIIIGSNIQKRIISDLKKKKKHYVIITDFAVYKIYGKEFLNNLKKNNIKADLIYFKAGEKNKNLKTISELSEKLLKLGADRKTEIIAFGGGVVGDVAGYVAGTYMRGISFIQIPTTLLAQVDSSVGGKVGVDLINGKNSSGLFHQPKGVYIDTDFLNKLPDLQLKYGLAEVVKYGVIYDSSLFDYVFDNIKKIFDRNKSVLINVIAKSCSIKAKVVESDEKESDARMILNYGHSIGHAIESGSNFKISHGRSIAIGMMLEAKLSSNLGHLSNKDLIKHNIIIDSIDLPLKYNVPKNKIIQLMKSDKKNTEGKIKIVLPKKIGTVIIIDDIPIEEIKKVLQ